MARRKRDFSIDLERTYFREWRKFRELNLVDVGEALGIHPTAISRLERSLSPYDQTHLQGLKEIYSCSIWELLYSDPFRPKPIDALVKKAALLSEQEARAVVTVIEAMLARH